MADPVYFDSSVFLAIFMGDASGTAIKELLRELRQDKTRICTSIITIQEVSVTTFRKRAAAVDNYTKVNKLARIHGVTKEIAITAAKIEAQILDEMKPKDREENRRRKWDCFHLATAMDLGCRNFYSLDEKQIKRGRRFCAGIWFGKPVPANLTLGLFKDLDTTGAGEIATGAATALLPDLTRKPCECGCGKYPKDSSSRFLSGHDLRKAYKDSASLSTPEQLEQSADDKPKR